MEGTAFFITHRLPHERDHNNSKYSTLKGKFRTWYKIGNTAKLNKKTGLPKGLQVDGKEYMYILYYHE